MQTYTLTTGVKADGTYWARCSDDTNYSVGYARTKRAAVAEAMLFVPKNSVVVREP